MIPAEDLLKQILLNSIDPEGKKYWIKSINRTSPSSLEGVTVQVASFDSDEVSNVSFGKYTLKLDGPLSENIDEINQNFYEALKNDDEKFKESFDFAQSYISRVTKELNDSVFSDMISMLQQGHIFNAESLKLTENKWQGTTTLVGHEQIIDSKNNSHYPKDRIFKRGEIYFADLDPIYPKEIGGTRPVLVIAVQDKDLVQIAPISSKQEYAKTYKNSVPLSFKDYPKLNYQDLKQDGVIVCTHALKNVNTDRIQDKIITIKEADMKKVREAITESLLLNQPIIDDKLTDILSTIPQVSKSKKLVRDLSDFPLTEDQIRVIAAAKIQSAKDGRSKLNFVLPKNINIVKDDEKGYPTYVAEGICTMQNGQTLNYTLKIAAFTASFRIGDNAEHLDDSQVRRPLAQTLLATYGEDYRQAYARYWVKTFCQRVKYKQVDDYYCSGLNSHLADVGLKSDNPGNLLENGLKNYTYSMLSEINNDNEND